MKRATIDRKSNTISIKFYIKDKQEWWKTLQDVKSLAGREFKAKQRLWVCPALDENIQKLKEFDFELTGDVPQTKKDDTPHVDPWLSVSVPTEQFKSLFPFQIEGLQFLKWRNGRGLICDEMGVGKTVQALSYLKLYPEQRPFLVVCPPSVKRQWVREFVKWVGNEPVHVLSGRTPAPLNREHNYVINWDILSSKQTNDKGEKVETGWVLELKKCNFQVIIGDEIQVLGNHRSNRSSAFKKLAKQIPAFIGLSGTPIRSRPYQFFTALNLIAPTTFSNRWKFYERYCDLKHNGFGWDYFGASRSDELHEIIRLMMVRRMKTDVAKHLPSKTRSVVPLDPGKLKIEAIKEWIEDFLQGEEKLVVFAWHIGVIEELYNHFSKIAVKYYGGTSEKDREQARQQFIENPKTRLFIGNIVAAGVGIDGLQNVCSNAVFGELIYTPKDLEQAEDRIHRQGSEKPVNIYYLIDPDSEEDEILMRILDNKNKMIDGIVDGQETPDEKLLRELRKKHVKTGKGGLI